MDLPPEWRERGRRALDPETPTDELAELVEDLGLLVIQNPAVTADMVRTIHHELAQSGVTYRHLPDFFHLLHENPARDLFLLEDPRFVVDLMTSAIESVAIFEAFVRAGTTQNNGFPFDTYAFSRGTVPSSVPAVSYRVPREASRFFAAEAKRLPTDQAPVATLASTQSFRYAEFCSFLVRVNAVPLADLLVFVDTIARVWADEFSLPARRLVAPGAVSFALPFATYQPSR